MKVRLEDVCERGSSDLKLADVIDKIGDYPVYGASGYIGNIDFYHQEKPYVTVVKDGAGIGRTTLCPAKSSIIGTMQYLMPKENVLPEYLCYVVKYMHLEKYFTGATIPHIYFKDYKNEEFNLDSLNKQTEIIEVLGRCERIMAARQKELDMLNTIIKARFVEMFGDPVSNSMGWKQDNMNSVCLKVTDGEHGSVPRSQSGHIFLNAKHIRSDGNIDFSTVTYIDDVTHEKIYKRCNPEQEDILLTTTGTIGNVAVVPSIEEFSMDRGITLLKLDKTMCECTFIANLLRCESMQNIMKANIHASAIGHLFLNKVMKLPVIVPPIELQNQFAAFVHQVNKSKAAVQKSLDEIQLLFDSLMQQYFS